MLHDVHAFTMILVVMIDERVCMLTEVITDDGSTMQW